MKILIDADGCPVVDITVQLAREFDIECLILTDTSHEIYREGAKTIVVSKGPDSVDLKLANMLVPNDIVITQDYGLASICLAKHANPISQDGMRYTNDNIDALLLFRHNAKKIRRAGGRLKGGTKRTAQQNEAFKQMLRKLIEDVKDEG